MKCTDFVESAWIVPKKVSASVQEKNEIKPDLDLNLTFYNTKWLIWKKNLAASGRLKWNL